MEREIKIHAIEIGTMEKLVILLRRKDEDVLVRCLECLKILCVEPVGKQKSIDMDLLVTVKPFLEDQVRKSECPFRRKVIQFHFSHYIGSESIVLFILILFILSKTSPK